jgi:hypothetical protein
MNKLVIKLLIVSLILLLYGCEYQLNDIYTNPVNKEVQPPDANALSINLDLQTDIIYLYNSKAINFNFSTDDQSIQGVVLFIDDKEEEVIIGSEGQFSGINYYALAEGNHSLELRIYTNSGTGSIADQLGQESFLLSRKWVLYVDKTYAKRKEKKVIDGLLQLNWAQNKNIDFKEFIIYKRIGGTNQEIGRTSETFFTDYSYVGEECSFDIKVRNGDGDFYWCSFEMEKQLPSLYMPQIKDNTFRICCSSSEFYNAIDSIIIEERFNYSDVWKRIKQTDNLTDTMSVLSNVFYSQENEFRLILVPKIDDKSNYRESITNYTVYSRSHIGFDIKQKDDLYYDFYTVSEHEAILEGDNGDFITYSFEKMKKVAEVACNYEVIYNITMSATGNNMTFNDGRMKNVVFAETKPVRFKKEIDLQKYYLESMMDDILVSDIGTCLFYDIYSGEKVLYDHQNEKEILRFNNTNFSLQLSFNGMYLWGGSNGKPRLLRFIGNDQVETVWELAYPALRPEFFQFSAVNEHEAVVWDKEVLRVIDCRTFDDISSFALTDFWLCNVDYYKKQVLSRQEDALFVRDLSSGEILHTIPLNPEASNWANEFYLINNKIISQDGVVYFL